MKEKKRAPSWLRWLMLALAIANIIVVVVDVQDYRSIPWEKLFSPEKLPVVRAEYLVSWATKGLLSLIFLFNVFTWDLPPKGRKTMFLNGGFLVVLTLLWLGAYCLIDLSVLGNWEFVWMVILAFMVGSSGYTLWKAVRTKE